MSTKQQTWHSVMELISNYEIIPNPTSQLGSYGGGYPLTL